MKSTLGFVILSLVLSVFTPSVRGAAGGRHHSNTKNHQNINSLDEDESGEDPMVIEQAKEELLKCLMPLIDGPEISKGIQNYTYAIKSQVFKSHCSRVPQMNKCFDPFLKKIESQLDEEDRDVTEIFRTVSDTMFEYICHAGGERIIQFLSSDGVKCVDSKALQMRSCLLAKIAEYEALDSGDSKESSESSSKRARRMVKRSLLQDVIPSNDLEVEGFECEFVGELEQCVIRPLRQCINTTPANLVQGLFDAINKGGPCNTHLINKPSVKQVPRKN